ncbi:E3 ubiquitin/ISG15 ligase TRIM25-like [Polypterus senegalus]|uniref:E3 ubiquitin/ISG15 ligase TRIM25-like n=1 Tax=Polypterus senegalus TaxID=55291 RepID=UPI0019651697|nr:E3 ubiquitin/ISG15 ligase TRIM25-like [Polypterus senegalus]
MSVSSVNKQMGATQSDIKERLEEEGVKIRRSFKMKRAMAKAQPFTYHDEHSCSVCLDTLTDPVSLHCGHSFCLKCLTNLYDQSQVCSCPECGESFTTRPELHINVELNEAIKKLKKMAICPPPSQNFAGPGDVECYVCPIKKFRAVKSCLTCMASFCQIHLKPHFDRATLKDHKLTDPDGNLQEKLCAKHQKCLEIFCKTDKMCICMMCVMTEHKGHEMVELETKRDEEKKQAMAKAQPFTYHDEHSCSVCLDTLTDPVSLHCGHSFCLKCLTNLYDQSQVCSCPECGESFTTRPELHINVELNEAIKKLKKMAICPPPSQNFAGPGDVECYVCPIKKFRAVKSCLTCMASFCQIHLKPHFDRATLKDHKLTDPDGNLQEKLCAKHQKCLEIFCKTDKMCICMMCVMTEHKGHEMVELETKRDEEKKQDEFICLVCLETLSDPISLPCGHSFCLKCLSDYWEQNQECSCPQCREIFTTRPELHINTKLNEGIKKLKMASTHPSQNCVGSGDVECDFCTGKKSRAVKSCLTCMVSYCQAHLQPHFEVEAWKDHKLTDPVRNLKEKLCVKHHKSLEIFCKTDETCICMMCGMIEHENHEKVELQMEKEEKQKQLEATRSEITRRLEERENKQKTTRMMVDKMKISVEKEVEGYEKKFTDLICCIEETCRKLVERTREQEKTEMEKGEGVIEQLKDEIEQLRRKDVELKELSETRDHIHFLQTFSSLCVLPADEDLPAVTADFSSDGLRKELSWLIKNLEKIGQWDILKWTQSGREAPVYTLKPNEPQSRAEFLHYFCSLTLDINTAHRRLRLSEENKKVTRDGTKANYPDHPNRFDRCPQVLCREALTGTRCYWEVEFTGENLAIGVAYHGLSRKGDGIKCGLGNNGKSWSLYWCYSQYSVYHNNKCTVLSAPYCPRIGVYLDWPAGSLSFYSVSHTMTLLHRLNTSFTKPLCPGFGVDTDCSVTICHLTPGDN